MTLRRWLYETLEITTNEEEEYERNIFGWLRILLLKIDENFFSKLKLSENEGGTYEQQYDQYVFHFQRYLSKKQFKRLKNSYEVHLRQSKDDNQLLKLALYLGINSNLKKEIVYKIICLSQKEQMQLMRALKEIQRECQQVIEIKKIIERIQLLEAANQQLKSQVQQKQNTLTLQINELNQVQEENRGLTTEIELYSYQKMHAFAQISSVEMQDFSYSCHSIKDQILKHTNNYEDLNCEYLKIRKNNAKLKQDLKLYGKKIKQRIEQLDKLKKQHKLTNEQFVLRQIPQYNNNQTLPPLCLTDTSCKINLSFSINHKSAKMDTDRTNCGSQQDLSFSQKQKKCNLGLLLQISQLQKEIQQKTERVKQLKRLEQNQKNKNRKLSKKLQRIKREHQQYTTRFMSQSSRNLELTAT